MIDVELFDFSRRLREIRLSRGMTQRDVGDALEIVANRISNWENGFGMPTLAMFRKLCLVLNCPPGDLLGLSHAPLSSDEYTLVQGFRSLDDAGQHTMLALLESQIAVRSEPSDG